MFFTPKSPSSFVLVHKYKVGGAGGGRGWEGSKPRKAGVIKKERGTRKDAKQCQVKSDYCFEISHRETQVLRQVNPLDTRDFSGCSSRKNLCLIDGTAGDRIHWPLAP